MITYFWTKLHHFNPVYNLHNFDFLSLQEPCSWHILIGTVAYSTYITRMQNLKDDKASNYSCIHVIQSLKWQLLLVDNYIMPGFEIDPFRFRTQLSCNLHKWDIKSAIAGVCIIVVGFLVWIVGHMLLSDHLFVSSCTHKATKVALGDWIVLICSVV